MVEQGIWGVVCSRGRVYSAADGGRDGGGEVGPDPAVTPALCMRRQ